jgi:uncharacterized membrane protein
MRFVLLTISAAGLVVAALFVPTSLFPLLNEKDTLTFCLGAGGLVIFAGLWVKGVSKWLSVALRRTGFQRYKVLDKKKEEEEQQ